MRSPWRVPGRGGALSRFCLDRFFRLSAEVRRSRAEVEAEEQRGGSAAAQVRDGGGWDRVTGAEVVTCGWMLILF